MRRLGKKLSYFTKVLLVFSLFFSNLSSMSVVFAYEGGNTNDFTVALTEDNNILIKYLNGELVDDTDEITATISEDYTYFDENETSEASLDDSFNLTGLELIHEEGVKFVSPMLSSVIFDGKYNVSVSLYNNTDSVDLGTVVFSKDIMHEAGLSIELYDSLDTLRVADSEGKYYVDEAVDTVVNIKAKILAGGLNPTDMFIYEDEELMAFEILNLNFEDTVDFKDLLFGEYSIPVKAEMYDNEMNEVVFEEKLNIMYGEYALNTEVLNYGISSVEGFDSFVFHGDKKDGSLYINASETVKHTALDLYKIGVLATEGSEDIKFSINNNDGDLLALYEEAKLQNEELLLEDYLESVSIDDNTVLSFVCRDLVITYTCVLVGDLDGNQLLEQGDLLELIDQVVGKNEINDEKSDLNGDSEVNKLDVMYLHQVLLNDSWISNITETIGKIDAKLNVMNDNIVSGDEFEINYVISVKDLAVNGITGLLNYDKEMLELISIEKSNSLTVGNNHDGKFLYLSDESLLGDEVTLEDGTVSIESKDYVGLIIKFKALKSGVSTVEIKDYEFINQNSYYVMEDDESDNTTDVPAVVNNDESLDNTLTNGEVSDEITNDETTNNVISVDVFVNESSDNTLKTLIVGGKELVLEDGVLEYVIDVTNDVTFVDVETVVSNIAASVTSIICPEELVEGENVISIVVTAENGDEKIYTIIVNREAAPKEETTTQLNYQNNYTEDNNVVIDNEPEKEEVIPSTEEDEDDDDEKVTEKESNLSRIIIIILILLVIAGLIYLIFKDEDDNKEVKKANKEINKYKKDNDFVSEKVEVKVDKPRNNKNSKKKKNNKKGR